MMKYQVLQTILQIGGFFFFVQLLFMCMMLYRNGELKREQLVSVPFVRDNPNIKMFQQYPQYTRQMAVVWSLSDAEKRKGLWEGFTEKELLDRGIGVTNTPPFQSFANNPSSAATMTDLSSFGNMTFIQIEERFDRCSWSIACRCCPNYIFILGLTTGFNGLEQRQLQDETIKVIMLMTHVKCLSEERIGNKDDGGWDVCTSGVFKPKPDGLVYSFGINNDFSFDDMMAKRFNSTVHSFDPTMHKEAHRRSDRVFFHDIGLAGVSDLKEKRWKSLSLEGVMEYLGHKNATLDMWKFDIEFSEFEVLNQVVRSGILRQVKQLAFELHMMLLKNTGAGLYQTTYEILLELERQGFRKFRSHRNPAARFVNSRTGRANTGCCIEVYYINLRFLTQN